MAGSLLLTTNYKNWAFFRKPPQEDLGWLNLPISYGPFVKLMYDSYARLVMNMEKLFE